MRYWSAGWAGLPTLLGGLMTQSDFEEAAVVMADLCVCGFLELLQMHQNLHELTLLESG